MCPVVIHDFAFWPTVWRLREELDFPTGATVRPFRLPRSGRELQVDFPPHLVDSERQKLVCPGDDDDVFLR
ncbi:hypothetical protein [Atrimonas thermophila]|uniref:hypothetical protein n=1 Tax=Atrimonas thermophila TaxID=3064161 RepID=UPI00399C85C6